MVVRRGVTVDMGYLHTGDVTASPVSPGGVSGRTKKSPGQGHVPTARNAPAKANYAPARRNDRCLRAD